MKITFDEYIKNPMGKENFVFSMRDMYKEKYTQKFDAVLAREAGKIEYQLYKTDDNGYVIHLKIPSEVVEKFYYDVVISFTSRDKTDVIKPTLSNYEVKFFSNDPSFVYTFVYSFNKNKLFISDLATKMSKFALENKAGSRNPKNEVGYVKSLYFAYLYMKLKGLFNKVVWIVAKPYNKSTLLLDIQNADEKIALRQKLGEEVLKEKKERQNLERKTNHPTSEITKAAIGRNIKNKSSNVRVYKKKLSGNIRKSHHVRYAKGVKRK